MKQLLLTILEITSLCAKNVWYQIKLLVLDNNF